MSNLLEICELSWSKIFPKGRESAAVSREEFIATGKSEFAYQQLLMAWKDKRDEGYFNVPSYLLTEKSLNVSDNEIDISGLDILRSLPQEIWLQNIGGLGCKCNYVKSDINITQLLCGDDSASDDTRTYLIVGQKIKFPQGAHVTPLPIIYANSGADVDGKIEVDDAIGALVRRALDEIYGPKGPIGVVDETNNQNSDN